MPAHSPDLTAHPPRSARCRLGGYVLLPRMLDKCRATIAGKNGSYRFACPSDQRILGFLGIEPEALQSEVARGKGDGDILAWITANQSRPHAPWEIQQWSQYQERRGPESDAESLQDFAAQVGELSKTRSDISSWMDLFDLEDFVNFGGQA